MKKTQQQSKCMSWVCEAGLCVPKLPPIHGNGLTQRLVVALSVALGELLRISASATMATLIPRRPGLVEPR